jgi:hypothetical protein
MLRGNDAIHREAGDRDPSVTSLIFNAREPDDSRASVYAPAG